MALEEYRRKRDFKRTPEPAGKTARRAGTLRYVIQKHAARRLHYDFRLEADGVLKSWAVPKGPSLDPSEKRLAVQVEDHPLEYGAFEGVIPQGEYGGGTVLLWDRGAWKSLEGDASAAIAAGKVKLELHGEKLRGGWTLVRMGGRANADGKNWLLIKEKDESARPLRQGDILEARPESVASGRQMDEIAQQKDKVWRSSRQAAGAKKYKFEPVPVKVPVKVKARPRKLAPGKLPGARKGSLPQKPEPQLATLVREAPTGEEWLHEIKFDGYRALGRIERGRARLISRNGKDWTDNFAAVAEAIEKLPVRAALLDGEVVALGPGGRSSFQALQQALKQGGQGLVYYVFDLLHLDGYDLTSMPLAARKEVLATLLSSDGTVRYSDHVTGNGPEFFAQACEIGVEGVISKRKNAPYRPGRGRDWLKIKCLASQEFVIGGFSEPSGARDGLGALLLGVHEDGELRYAGKVGTGFDTKTLSELRRRLAPLEQERPSFSNPPPGKNRGVHWVRPQLVAEVDFTEWTDEGLLRHPTFKGLREDKPARDVVRERPKAAARSGKSKKSGPPEVAGVRLTNPDRVLWPEQGIVKLDLVRYYEAVADWILPHVTHRPLMIYRCPQGYGKGGFFQKHVNESTPEPIRGVEIEEDEGEIVRYLMIEDLAGLITLAQLAALELHTWGAPSEHVEGPDRLVLDLDPDESLPWERVVEAAFLVRDKLAALELASWVKTTGGKGLHVVVPLDGRGSWELVRDFSHALALQIVAEAPDRYVAEVSKARRKGKIYVDYVRNTRGATWIAPYSTRARSGAPVSTPITWTELERGLRPAELTLRTVPERLAALSRDPWQGFSRKQSLERAVRRLTKGKKTKGKKQ
jgi:bifunctional non-homologous end joining protein LigD